MLGQIQQLGEDMSQATIPCSKDIFDQLNKKRYELAFEEGKRVTWDDFLKRLIE